MCFIYWLEPGQPERHRFLEEQVFRPLVDGSLRAVTSAVTLTELLVPYFLRGETEQAELLRRTLDSNPGLAILEVDSRVAVRAAELRARLQIKPMDALHVATAIVAGAEAFLTNDRRLARGDAGIEVLILDDLASA